MGATVVDLNKKQSVDLFDGTIKATVDVEISFQDFYEAPTQADLDKDVRGQIEHVVGWAIAQTQVGVTGLSVKVDKIAFIPADKS